MFFFVGLLAAAPPGLDRAAIDVLRSRVLPAEPELWETIPWRTDLLAARREALGAGKPLFCRPVTTRVGS
jgi:hypothetical protein